ncbi:MAG: LuxR C-terminal-related transcriptional regulator [Actinomycetes bacterium]
MNEQRRATMEHMTILTRELTPFEHLVAGLLCDGLSNSAIARETAHSEKVVENTVSRMSKALGVKSAPDINIRVLIALAFRAHFGDKAFDKLDVACSHMVLGPNGEQVCSRHIE